MVSGKDWEALRQLHTWSERTFRDFEQYLRIRGEVELIAFAQEMRKVGVPLTIQRLGRKMARRASDFIELRQIGMRRVNVPGNARKSDVAPDPTDLLKRTRYAYVGIGDKRR